MSRKGNRGQARKTELQLNKQFRKAVDAGDTSEMQRLMALLTPLPQVFAPRVEKTEKVCKLPSCTRTTKHNGGYCCAEHHALDTQVRRVPDGLAA